MTWFRNAALLACVVTVMGCAATPVPQSRVIEAADLSAYDSFAFTRDEPMVRRSLSFPELDSLTADRSIRAAITRVMIEKGYEAASRDRADLLVSYILDVREFAVLPEGERRQYFRTGDSRSPFLSGRRTELTVTITMVERHTGIELWNASGQADWPDGDTIVPVIDRAVEAALADVKSRL